MSAPITIAVLAKANNGRIKKATGFVKTLQFIRNRLLPFQKE
jgi:hypothetical protein